MGKLALVLAGMSALASTGCMVEECLPPPEVTVTLSQEAEDVRSLPVHASGASQLLGQDFADSHGVLRTRVDVDGASRVDIQSLALAVDVGETPLDIRVTAQYAADRDADEEPFLIAGETLEQYFRARQLTDILLPEGADYDATITLAWRAEFPDNCPSFREGTAVLEVMDTVAAAADTGSFQLQALGEHEAAAPDLLGRARFRMFAEVSSGLSADVMALRSSIAYFGADTEALVPAIGLALFTDTAMTVDGAAGTVVAPGEVMAAFSSDAPAASPPPYTVAGTSAVVGDITSGKAVVTVEVDYDLVDGTAGVETDVLVQVVDTLAP